jgi:hypothetical protein
MAMGVEAQTGVPFSATGPHLSISSPATPHTSLLYLRQMHLPPGSALSAEPLPNL